MTVTRRQALVAGIAAPLLLAAAPARADLSGDAAVLYGVSEVEVALRYAYELVADADGLDAPRLQTVARDFAAQESEHLGALATSLEALGSQRPTPPDSPEALDRAVAALGVRPGFTSRRGAAELAALLLALEDASARALVRGVGRLADPNLIETALTILGCQAQHRVVLERLPRRSSG